MNNKFDELTKSMAQSVTRRGTLKKFGVGLAGVVLASLGLANKAEAGNECVSHCKRDCAKVYPRGTYNWELCWQNCVSFSNCKSGV